MTEHSKILSKLADRMANTSPPTSKRYFADSDQLFEQTIGIRYHHFIVSVDHLGIGEIADITHCDGATILSSALSLALLDDARAWEMLNTPVPGIPEMDNVDRLANVLDSWYSRYKSALLRTFSFIKDYLNVSDVLMHDNNHALIEILEEYDISTD